MVTALFTLDYEIHGNGDGCPLELMIEPTNRLMDLLDSFGAKLTIMADVAEILKFREYLEETGHDRFHFGAIVEQLRDAIRRGHDVQLHLHSSYFNAIYDGTQWAQDWAEYSFADLPFERMREMVETGKEFLEDLLVPARADYRCIAFRAANWSVNPSANVVRALSENGILLDTSVFKYGRRSGMVSFDYKDAASEFAPWKASDEDLSREDRNGKIWEVPIASEARWIGAFFTGNRVKRVLQSRRHPFANTGVGAVRRPDRLRTAWKMCKALFQRHAWKADFNQCTGRQLIGAAKRIEMASEGRAMPMVLIGHSKLFDSANARSLQPFLEFVRAHTGSFRFGLFRDVLEELTASEECAPIGTAA